MRKLTRLSLVALVLVLVLALGVAAVCSAGSSRYSGRGTSIQWEEPIIG